MKASSEGERAPRRAVIGGTLAVVLLAAGLIAGAAIASRGAASAVEPNGTPSTTGVASTAPPAWATAPPAPEVEPRIGAGEAASLTSKPWSLISQDGNKLRIVYAVGDSCATAKGFAVTYTATSVTLSALSQIDATHGGCLSLLTVAAATVVLPEPLNGRALVHAAVEPRSADSEIGN